MSRKNGRSGSSPDQKKLARRIARLEKRVGSAVREEKRRARRLDRARDVRAELEGRLASLRSDAAPLPAAAAAPNEGRPDGSTADGSTDDGSTGTAADDSPGGLMGAQAGGWPSGVPGASAGDWSHPPPAADWPARDSGTRGDPPY